MTHQIIGQDLSNKAAAQENTETVSEKKTQDTVFQNVDIVYFKQQSGIEKYNIFKDGTFLSWSSTSIMHTASSYLLRTVPRGPAPRWSDHLLHHCHSRQVGCTSEASLCITQ
jgi:hypothetical protein